ncbi:MAG: peptidase M48 Ste24p [Deltaproteobacteria bacterium]|nr:peptidase M48 Ste24p [Deltaproteobacteria bacterium]
MQRILCIPSVLILAISLILPARIEASLLGEFTIRDEAKLGEQLALVMAMNFDMIDDPVITGYILDLGRRIAEGIPPQPFPFRLNVVNNNAMNAFATAAGYVYIFSGLILNVEAESELAGVMAHEFAHVTERHIARSIEQSKLIGLGTLAGMLAGIFLGTQGDGQAGSAVLLGSLAGSKSAALKYSREHEREADHVGFNYLTGAGFDPRGLPEAFKKIRRLAWLGGSSIPSYLSTHPGVDERIGYLEQRIDRLPGDQHGIADDNTRLYLVQALLRARYSNPQNALAFFDQSAPTCFNLLGRAMTLSRLNRITDSEEAFQRALACSDLDSRVLSREYGRFHYEYGDSGLAARHLLKAVSLDPSDTMALFFYARILAERGQRAEAVEYLQRILRGNPHHKDAHRHLALIYGQDKNTFRAYLHLTHADMLDLRDNLVRKRLREMKNMELTDEERLDLEKLENLYQERQKILAGKN